MGRLDEARVFFEKALTVRERLARENPSMTENLEGLGQSHNNIGGLQEAAGRLDEALASYEKASEIRERVALQSPLAPYRGKVVLSRNNVGIVLNKMGRLAEALASLEKTREIGEQLAREVPQTPEYSREVARTSGLIGSIALEQRRWDEARTNYRRAIEWVRKALVPDPKEASGRAYLVWLLSRLVQAEEALGHVDEAAAARREIADLKANDPAKAALDAKLAAVLNGQEPDDEAERARLALRAYEKFQYAASARLFTEALANDPRLADDRVAQHAYNGACAAALAGTGQGKDVPVPDESARVKLRRQALDWLRAELAAWGRVFGEGTSEMKARIEPTLRHWKEDSDLIGIRDEQELAKLPQAEREAFRHLWDDVDRLLATPVHP